MLQGVIFIRLNATQWAVGLGPFTRSSKRPTQTSFFLPGFFLEESEPWWTPAEYQELSFEEFLKLWPEPQPFKREWALPSEPEFLARVENILTQIHKGELKKAVPVVFEKARGAVTLEEMSGIVHRFGDLPSEVFPYGYFSGSDRGIGSEGMIGVTPEFLLRDHGAFIESLALAGTTKVENEGALLKDPKELSEHLFVVNDLSDRLSRYGKFEQGGTREWAVGMVRHLRTDVKVSVEACIDFEDWIEVLHPTPALGVAPRTRAEWLRSQPEALERRHFGAPFGVMRVGGASHLCLVCIRGIQWRENQIWLGSGCGVVEGSVASREWEELKLKRRAVKRMLGLES